MTDEKSKAGRGSSEAMPETREFQKVMSEVKTTPKLLIQAYLEEDGTMADLVSSYTIKSRRHGKYENLVLLKYGIEAAFMNPMVRECRGIILDEARNWAVVSRAFDKFGNDGEGYVPEIYWSTARVQEKLDGSLCVLYHYDGAWHVATSGTPDACGEVHGAGGTFAEYFWKTFATEGGHLPEASDLCFAFELMGPDNRIVVVHDKPWMRLLAVRDGAEGRRSAMSGHVGGSNLQGVRRLGRALAALQQASKASPCAGDPQVKP